MGLQHTIEDGNDDELAVRSATFWGAFALDHAWCLTTGSLPQCSRFPHLPPKPTIIEDVEASLWVPYTDEGAPQHRALEQPSNVRSVYKCFCELSELIHESLYLLHSPSVPFTANQVLGIYTQYFAWYGRIPEVLRLGYNFTPAVLFVQYYHFAMLLLFRPLISYRIIGSGVAPQDVCSQAADAIQALLASYAQLYTLKRTASFVPYFVLTATVMKLDIGTAAMRTATPGEAAEIHNEVVETLERAIIHLQEMVACHRFAAQALSIVLYLAKEGNIAFKSDDLEIVDDHDQPRDLHMFFSDVPARDSISPLARKLDQAGTSMQIPMFRSLVAQAYGRVPEGKALDETGFQEL
ncbi:fungal specific transcription factor domain-containing protein [Purpureocillium lilacinum]|uniref:Fungal specific transcription factor domain-containing protein n=1 Tax=Purpureocillium lilacinum TaxID=33203 RepID=A0A179F1E4_PURLI|nr:fungal specific transcription factor domain-containing protein [Purpureocillium lilacinum]